MAMSGVDGGEHSVRRRHTVGSVPSAGELEMQLNAGLLRRHSTSNRTQYPQSSRTSPSYTSIPLIEEGSGRGNENYGDASLFHKAVSVIWPYFRYEPLSRVWVFVVLVLAAAHTSLSVVTSFAERDLTTALATKNQPEFFQGMCSTPSSFPPSPSNCRI